MIQAVAVVATAAAVANRNALQLSSIIKLHPITDNNIGLLFNWRNSKYFLENCSHRQTLNNISSFITELQNDFERDKHLQFLIVYNDTYVGTIYSYSYNSFDKYCFLTVFIDEVYTNKGIALKTCIYFIRHLFIEYKLFKVYFDTYSYNKNVLKILKKLKLSCEGNFIKQRLSKDNRFDVLRFAVYKEDIDKF